MTPGRWLLSCEELFKKYLVFYAPTAGAVGYEYLVGFAN